VGKFNFGIDSTSAASEELGDGFYAGPTPPKGIYTCLVKQFKIKKNRNDDFRLSVLLEVQEPEDSDKAQYNGFGFWGGYNVTDQGRPWINNLLDGIGAKRKDFWDEKITTSPGKIDKDTAQDVLKIGARKTTGHMVRVSCKYKAASEHGDETLEPQRFLDEDVPQRGADAEPDETATGLGGTDAAEEEGTEEAAGEGYTQEELDELDKADLAAICDEWEVEYAPKATKATLIKLILKAQAEAEEEAEEAEEEAEDASAAQSALSEDNLTESDLEEMEKADLVAYMEEKGWEVPKPAIPSRLRKLILQFQAEPPF
jgi:hypothetical protein